jgi:hypothetical protein
MKDLKEFESIVEFKKYAKNLVADNLDIAFQALKPIVEQNSDLYNSWILYKGRHKDTQKYFNQNIYNKDKLDIERNKVRTSILQLIDSFTESDFQNMQVEVHINEKLYRIQKTLKDYEEKVISLTRKNSEIQKDKEKIILKLQKQKTINDNKIKALQVENERLKGLAQNYEETKKQVRINEALIEELKNENKSLNESNKKLSKHELTIQDNLRVIENLKKEKESLLNEVKNIREQEKALIANKKLIEVLKNENIELKEKIVALKTQLHERADVITKPISRSLDKKLLFGGIIIALILLSFSTIQFISNQKLHKKLFSLNEQVEEYQHKEADEEINKFVDSPKMNSDQKINSLENGCTVKAMINNINFDQKNIEIEKESKIKRLYKIEYGEGALQIAKKFKMSLEEFKKINPCIKNIDSIKSGNFITVYDIVLYKKYIVQPRETISTIRKRYKMFSYEVEKINNIDNPDSISIGQKLIVFKSRYY